MQDLILKQNASAQVELVKSGGGVFEIVVDGRLAYSKKATGEFPSDDQALATLG